MEVPARKILYSSTTDHTALNFSAQRRAAATAFCCKPADPYTHTCVLCMHTPSTLSCCGISHTYARVHAQLHTHTLLQCAFLKYGDNLFVSWCLIFPSATGTLSSWRENKGGMEEAERGGGGSWRGSQQLVTSCLSLKANFRAERGVEGERKRFISLW